MRRTVGRRQLRTQVRREGRLELLEPPDRPRVRADCRDGPRPCPYVRCRHHLYADVKPNGSLTLNFPGADVSSIPETCALDVAELDGLTLDAVGQLLGGLSRERVRQIEAAAIDRLVRAGILEGFGRTVAKKGRPCGGQSRVLRALERLGPSTANEVAHRLRRPAESVRRALSILRANGRADVEDDSARPKIWRAT